MRNGFVCIRNQTFWRFLENSGDVCRNPWRRRAALDWLEAQEGNLPEAVEAAFLPGAAGSRY